MSQIFKPTSGSSSDAVLQLTPDDLNPVLPAAGNINVFGLNGISTSNGGASTLYITGGVGLLENTGPVTITSTQVKNLSTVPQTLLIGQGANTIIATYAVTFVLDYGGTSAFNNVGDLRVAYYDGVSFFDIVAQSMSGFLDGTVTAYFPFPLFSTTYYTAAQAVNMPVVVYNAGANIGGNAANDNALIIQLQYVVLTV